MYASPLHALEILFTPEAHGALGRLAPSAQRRVIDACESLAELAAVAPLPPIAVASVPLTSATSDATLTYEIDAANRLIRVLKISPR